MNLHNFRLLVNSDNMRIGINLMDLDDCNYNLVTYTMHIKHNSVTVCTVHRNDAHVSVCMITLNMMTEPTSILMDIFQVNLD